MSSTKPKKNGEHAYKKKSDKLREKDKELGRLKVVVEEFLEFKDTTEVGKENGQVDPNPASNVRITCLENLFFMHNIFEDLDFKSTMSI